MRSRTRAITFTESRPRKGSSPYAIGETYEVYRDEAIRYIGEGAAVDASAPTPEPPPDDMSEELDRYDPE